MVVITSYLPSNVVLFSNQFEEIKKKASIKIFTGDVDAIGTKASEIGLSIDISKLQELISASQLPSLDDVFLLFDELKYRKRTTDIEFEKYHARNKNNVGEIPKRTKKVFKKNDTSKNVTQGVSTDSTTKFLKEGLKANLFVDVEFSLRFQTFLSAIKFSFQYIRLVAS